MSKFTDWFKPIETRDAEAPASPLPGVLPPARGTYDLSVKSALSVSSINRAVSIITTHAAQLEFGTFRGENEIPSAGLIQRPDFNQYTSDWVKNTVFSLACYGNAYWQVFVDAQTGRVNKLVVLKPDAMGIRQDNNGNIFYDYSGWTQPVTLTKFQPFSPSSNTVVHLKLQEVPWSLYGSGPLQLCQRELRGLFQLRDYVDHWFDTSGVPTGILTTKDYLDGAAAEEYKARWYETLKDGGTAVLGSGMQYDPVALDPEQSQFVAIQQLSIAAVARMFGLPASYMLAPLEGSTDTYANLQQENIKFVNSTLMAYLLPIENGLSDFVPNTQQVKFKLATLLRADDAARATIQALYIQNGVLSTEEVRDQENFGPKQPGQTFATPVLKAEAA